MAAHHQLRASGQYVSVQGTERRVDRVQGHQILLKHPIDLNGMGEKVHRAECGPVIRVDVSAEWRGTRAQVAETDGTTALIRMSDRATAEVEGMSGNPYDGWTAVVPVDELTNVQEKRDL